MDTKSKRYQIVFTFLIIVSFVCSPIAVTGKSIQGSFAMSHEQFNLHEFVSDMQPGWNLGNSFDAIGGETNWGNPATTQEIIEAIADAGFKSIRIPVTWHERMGPAPDYTISERYLARVQEVVDWSLDAGLYVMINMHHDTRWIIDMPTNYDEVIARYVAAWEQIAHHFRDYGHKLLIEGLNEPRFDEDWNRDTPQYFTLVDELNTTFHEIVRASGGNNALRPLVISTLTGSTSRARLDQLLKTIEALDDERIIATVHYYGFWPFSVNVGGSTTFYPEAYQDVIETFDRVHRTFTAKGIPVIVGEYGLLGFDKDIETIQHGESMKFFEFVTHYGQEQDFLMMLWDNGQHFDRRALVWRDEALHSIITSGSERSSYTDIDTIFVKEGEPLEDVTLQLTLHGNTLHSITHQGSPLQQGMDYEVDGEQLIVKSSLIQSLLTEGYGLNASLYLHFSAGIPWQLDIVSYTTPVVSGNIGTNMLAIPTEFNGDRLLTMSAVYKGGGNAGPQDWTPYKEFNYAFNVSYEHGAIQLLREFFDEVRDGELDIKLYFQSGEVLGYEVTKDKSNIIGRSLTDPDPDDDTDSDGVAGGAGEDGTSGGTEAEGDTNGAGSSDGSDAANAGNGLSGEGSDTVAGAISADPSQRGSRHWITISIILVVIATVTGASGLFYRRVLNKD